MTNLINECDELIEELIKISSLAGKKIMEHYGNIDFKLKEDSSPVTIADLESNKILMEHISQISAYKIRSEEDLSELNEHIYWSIDPLDGTRDFIKQNNEFCINIALIKNKQAILGLIHAPALKETYYAIKGSGAYSIKDGRKIKIQKHKRLKRRHRAAISNFHSNEETNSFCTHFNFIPSPLGAALKFPALALDVVQIYPRFNGSKEWDTAAGEIILEEAGGITIDLKTGLKMEHEVDRIKNNFFISFSPRLLDLLSLRVDLMDEIMTLAGAKASNIAPKP